MQMAEERPEVEVLQRRVRLGRPSRERGEEGVCQ